MFQFLVHLMGKFWSFVFNKTFKTSCGELVEQVKTLRIGIGKHNGTSRIKPSQKLRKT